MQMKTFKITLEFRKIGLQGYFGTQFHLIQARDIDLAERVITFRMKRDGFEIRNVRSEEIPNRGN